MEARTTAGSSWATSLMFAIGYALAALVGRLTVIDQGAGLGLFWPAAGLGVLWMLIRGGLYPLDLALFAAVTFAVNHLTGSSVASAHASWPCRLGRWPGANPTANPARCSSSVTSPRSASNGPT